MPTIYTDKAPGVYVEEVASGSAPIAGVGTSTAGFIGVYSPEPGPTAAALPEVSEPIPLRSENEPVLGSDNSQRKTFSFDIVPPLGDRSEGYDFFYQAAADEGPREALTVEGNRFSISEDGTTAEVTFARAIPSGQQLMATYTAAPQDPSEITPPAADESGAAAGEVKLCTNFTEFKQFFGDFSEHQGQSHLAHAVYGFFRNGGTRCYVVRVATEDDIAGVLEHQFAAIDEIALVLTPGLSTAAQTVVDHCASLQNRFALLDGPATADLASPSLLDALTPGFTSSYAALYFPWIEVYDPATKAPKAVPPSGHMAGIYARVDTQRGVHKAPANERVLGATGLAYSLSKAKQGPLNQAGVNCIRSLNGNILVWGARTLGGDANGEFKYIGTRRLFNYLCESIDQGTQWTVFEPNSPELWAAIRRNVSAFLTLVWRGGALFGATPEQAFYVKCDAETNPPEQRELGQVVTEIGVAVVKPAEFVVFRLSQWLGGEG